MLLNILPPLQGLELLNLFFISLQSNMQVVYRFCCHEKHEDTGVVLGVWALDVTNLKIHLKRATTFIPTDFDPNLLIWNYPIMPGKVVIATCKIQLVMVSCSMLHIPGVLI